MKSDRTVSRFTFELVSSSGVLLLMFIELLVGWRVTRAFHLDPDVGRGFVAGAMLPNMILARLMADRFFRSMGLSRSGRMVEARLPAPVATARTPEDENLVIRVSRSASNGFALLGLGLAGFGLLVGLFSTQSARWDVVFIVCFGLCGAFFFFMRYYEIIRLDHLGVSSYRTQYSVWKTAIPWTQIASCELTVVRDTFGEIATAYPVLRDLDGREVFRGLVNGLAMTTPEDRQKLFGILKGRFPKLDVDPWEL